MSKMFPRWFKWMMVFAAIFAIICMVMIYVLGKKQGG